MVTALGELGLESMAAFALEEGLLRADVALPASQIAIAIDGEEGFCVNQPKQPLGSTILNWRLLAARGWKVNTTRVQHSPFFASVPARLSATGDSAGSRGPDSFIHA